MTSVAAPPVVRLTLRGPHDVAGVTPSLDLVSALGAPLGSLLVPDVLAALGLTAGAPVRIVDRTGQQLPLDALLGSAVVDGDLLLVATDVWASLLPGGAVSRGRADRSAASYGQGGLLIGAALCLLGAGAVALGSRWASTSSDTVQLGVGGSLLLLALLTVGAPRGRRGDWCRLLAPGCAALGAALLVLRTLEPGVSMLAVTAAAVAAAVTAATLLTGRSGASEGLRVWLGAAGLLALAVGGSLILGVDGTSLAAFSAALALCFVPMLPALAIDVPDEALLEVDQAAAGVWARTTRGRRRLKVRRDDVTDQVRSGRRMLDAAVAAAVVIAIGSLVVVLLAGAEGLSRWGALVLAGCLACGLALKARSARAGATRLLLLAGGALAGLALVLALLRDFGTTGRAGTAVVAGIAGAATALAAVALGHGWRSVRWARSGDLLETAAVVLALPAALVAAGGIAAVRGMVS